MIAFILRKIRKERNWTQLEIAQKLSIPRTSYANWEQGVSEPSFEDLRKLCVIFDISGDEILGLETEEDRKAIKINNSFNNNNGQQNINIS